MEQDDDQLKSVQDCFSFLIPADTVFIIPIRYVALSPPCGQKYVCMFKQLQGSFFL